MLEWYYVNGASFISSTIHAIFCNSPERSRSRAAIQGPPGRDQQVHRRREGDRRRCRRLRWSHLLHGCV